jgi:hypothetical protein
MSTWTQRANSSTGGKYPKAPPGNHPAVLVAMVSMGTQKSGYAGEEGWQERVYLLWELVTEEVPGTGRNHLIGTDVTLSLNAKAKLRQWVEARLGRPISDGEDYDVSAELGKPCYLNVVLKGGYPRVEGVGAVPKGITVPPPKNKPVAVSLDDFQKNGAGAIPGWVEAHWHFGRPISAHVRECREIAGEKPRHTSQETAPVVGGGGNKIPF